MRRPAVSNVLTKFQAERGLQSQDPTFQAWNQTFRKKAEAERRNQGGLERPNPSGTF